MITFHGKEKQELQTFHSKGKPENRRKWGAWSREKKELLKRRGLGDMENGIQSVKRNFTSLFFFQQFQQSWNRNCYRGEMEKDSLKQKVIQKKIFCGSHLGHCRSKNSLYSLNCGGIQSSLAGVRGDLSLFRPLSSQRYIFQTLLFLLELLKKGGRILVVDAGDRSLSLLSWSERAELQPFLSSQEQQELVSNTLFQKGGSQRAFSLPSLIGKGGGKLENEKEQLLHFKCKGQLLQGKRNPPHIECKAGFTSSMSGVRTPPLPFPLQKEFAWSGEKWFGGALTNWDEISKKIYQFATLLKEIPSDTVYLSSRFEKWMRGFPGFLSALAVPAFPAKLEHLEKPPAFASILGAPLPQNQTFPLPTSAAILPSVLEACKMTKTGEMRREIRLRLGKQVDGILLINPNENRDVIAEARLRKIPVIGFADSITNLSGVDLSIPINLSSLGETFIFLSILFQLGGRLSATSKGEGVKKLKSHIQRRESPTTSEIFSKRN
jgi:hypothetical protein